MSEAKAAGASKTKSAPTAKTQGPKRTLPGLGDFNWKDLVTLAAIAVAIAGISIAAVRNLDFLSIAEQWLIDFRLTALSKGQPEPHPGIVVVTITEETLATLEYRQPVDRDLLADTINQLRAKGAQVVGVDLLFDQPTIKEKDDALRAALNGWPVAPVVAWAGFEEGLTRKQAQTLEGFFEGVRVRRGYVTLESDKDGTIRAIYPGREDEFTKQFELGFPGAVAAQVGANPPRRTIGLNYLTRNKISEPMFLRYEAQLVPVLPPELFKDKIVLIGADLPDADRHRTPLATVLGHGAGSLPGVVIHAQALSQLLDGRTLPRVDRTTEILLTILSALVAMALILLETKGWIKALAVAFVVGLFVAIVSLPLYFSGPLLPLVAPVIAFLGAVTVGSLYVAGRYRDKKRFIRDAFGRSTDAKVVKQLLEDPSALVTEGETRELTLLFTDMENFTVMSESIDPRLLVSVMSRYFEGICELVIKNGGTIDKFIGDAVVAIFGAPLPLPDHGSAAVDCAMAIRKFTEDYREIAQKEYGVKLGPTRIGVHSGIAIIGNFGGSQRDNYTAMGDTVNTASRLESANKFLGTQICVSEATARQCKRVIFLPLGTLRLKGKQSRIDAYTPVDKDSSALPWFRTYMDAYRMLRDGNTAAAEIFAKVAPDSPAAPIAAMHAKRMQSGARDPVVALDSV
ncbi:MAG: adenylate/guanylate cyclase domain-containing protein [Rhodospirillales bacterium]|nr:adenylate/guanylate cyclase domain-containing protein [Rhodospirillales bacterium]